MENDYDSIDQTSKANKKNSVLVIVLTLLVLVLGAYITYDKFFTKKPAQSKLEEKELKEEKESEVKESESDTTFIDLSECSDEKCDYLLSFAKREVSLSIDKRGETVSSYKVLLNDKVIEEGEKGPGGAYVEKILTNKESIIISSHQGSDIKFKELSAYNLEGERLFRYRFLDLELGEMRYNGEIEIKDNNLIVGGTRLNHGPTIDLSHKLGQVFFCSKESLSEAGITENEIIEAKYIIEYQGRSKYLAPVIKEQTTIKEYLELNKDFCK